MLISTLVFGALILSPFSAMAMDIGAAAHLNSSVKVFQKDDTDENDVNSNIGVSATVQANHNKKESDAEDNATSSAKISGMERALQNHESKVQPTKAKNNWQRFIARFEALFARKNNKNEGVSATTTAKVNPTFHISPTFAFRITSTATDIFWFTSSPSDSKVWVSAATSVSTATSPVSSSTSLSFFHDTNVSGLASSTAYFYTVASTNASGNTVTSSGNFTTK